MNVTKETNIQIRLLVEDSQQLVKLKDKNESHQNKLKKTLDEKTDLHHICAVQMWVSLVQSYSKCSANGVNATFAPGFATPM